MAVRGGPAPALNYSQEARRLWDRLGIQPEEIGGKEFSAVDVIYRSQQGGCLYVGGERVARDLQLLRKMEISTVVNCTTDIRNYHEAEELQYYTFNIAWWKRTVMKTDIWGFEMPGGGEVDEEKAILDFLLPLMEFLEERLVRGENTLIHCLAGAHRAGTTGILCLMHFASLDAKKAVSTARSLRSIIEPIGDFRQLLEKCDQLPRGTDGKFKRKEQI